MLTQIHNGAIVWMWIKFNKGGEDNLVKLDLLNNRIKDSGMTMVSIAEKTGVSRETLYNKLNGTVDFKASEILSISDVLRLSVKERDEIFFAR